ncbi:MAG TPA: glycoside hydrolase family 3 C-terminal domain-containing protein [Bacillota bacterium]|nr:glycoside hydrolase family 3 C-terminal domain-containing protein [Bacillota bacterium]HOK68447.1 glycoside hydrolase family 3 C-terminal domain-containing protein [Bacillota bacterium]HPP85081.1 glycoside hydrolase family 3 C-terminal domain-containing protein [Bacillota bacterium]
MKHKNNVVKGFDLTSLKEEPLPGFARFARKAAAEGIVLLKNDGVLPFRSGTRLSIFGRIQFHYYKSGTGSGGNVNPPYVTNIIDSLRKRKGITVNEKLAAIYDKWIKDHPFDYGNGWTQPWSQAEMPLDDAVVAEAAAESDAALVIIGRTAGEDKDCAAVEGSYLLSAAERDMLAKVTKHFDKVCVALNTGNILDMKWVNEYKVGAVLYVWQGGMEGGNAAADVLTGKVTPSGKLSDTIAYDITDYPSAKNFGGDAENKYEEDIYVGYRYFETAGKEKVLYPFGFGLSYTTFQIEVTAAAKNGKITVKAVVANTGAYSGKEVVQVYFSAPQGRLGRPARELIGFKKTKLLKPGERQTLTISFQIRDMATYDDSGATGHKSCYVLEPGEYTVYAGTDVRSAQKVFSYTIHKTRVTEKLTEIMAPVKPFNRMRPVQKDGGFVMAYEPVPLRTIDLAKRISDNLPEDIPYTGDKGIRLIDVYEGRAELKDFVAQFADEDLACLSRGEGMNSPKVTAGSGCAFGGVTDRLVAFGIPPVCGSDGPSGVRLVSDIKATALPVGTLLACTWNEKLVEELYVLEGIEMTAYKIDVLLGPGMNIHRNPLGGRNFEYFSEDPLLTGKIAAAISRGLNRAGVTGTLKHFIANNQETNRHTADSVMSERCIREIYTKAFKIAVQEGNATAIMTSYNPVNGIWTASNYDLNTTLLRNEWGYTGFVMTDWWAMANDEGGPGSKENLKAMAKAQNDIYMVCADAATNKDNLMDALASGELKRGELQRNAMNLLRYILKTRAFARFLADGCALKNNLADKIDRLNTVYETETVSSGAEIALHLAEAGQYLLVLELRADTPVLTQTSMRILVNGHSAASVVTNGTEGETATKTSALSLVKGETRFLLKYPNEITVRKLKLMK